MSKIIGSFNPLKGLKFIKGQPMSQQMDKEIRTFISNHPKSKDMQAEASKYLPGGSSRATAYFDPYPFFVDKT